MASGAAAGAFEPDLEVTREQAAKFLMRAFRLELYGP
jgi:hypothetical protein